MPNGLWSGRIRRFLVFAIVGILGSGVGWWGRDVYNSYISKILTADGKIYYKSSTPDMRVNRTVRISEEAAIEGEVIEGEIGPCRFSLDAGDLTGEGDPHDLNASFYSENWGIRWQIYFMESPNAAMRGRYVVTIAPDRSVSTLGVSYSDFDGDGFFDFVFDGTTQPRQRLLISEDSIYLVKASVPPDHAPTLRGPWLVDTEKGEKKLEFVDSEWRVVE